MRVTIKDISRLSGISTSTISRVLTNNVHVSPETVRKVKEAADMLGYIPNGAARSLVNNRRNMIGLIVPELENPFYTEIIQGVEETAAGYGYGTILSCHMGNTDSCDSIPKLLELGVDGIIHAGLLQEEDQIQYLCETNIPYVLLGRKLENAESSYVVCDDYGSSYKAAKYLIGLGHSEIVFIFGKQKSFSSHQKLNGYLDALRDSGIEKDECRIVKGNLSYDGAYRAVSQLLEEKVRFTAILGSNDMMAIGAMDALKHEGYRVPEDASVIGIDDIFWGKVSGIDLTTIHVPKYEMGCRCFEILKDLIQEPEAEEAHCVLEGKLVERKSCRTLL